MNTTISSLCSTTENQLHWRCRVIQPSDGAIPSCYRHRDYVFALSIRIAVSIYWCSSEPDYHNAASVEVVAIEYRFSTFLNRELAMGFFSRPAHDARQVDGTPPSYDTSNDAASGQILSGKGDLKFTVEQGGNGSMPSYQEVSGAPVETISSLGYAVGPVTIIFMNISQMVGTGVYSTRSLSSLFISLDLSLTFPSGDNS